MKNQEQILGQESVLVNFYIPEIHSLYIEGGEMVNKNIVYGSFSSITFSNRNVYYTIQLLYRVFIEKHLIITLEVKMHWGLLTQ